ncbi:hypothetical protein FOZ61_000145 [Perkinsus olseni]|uniref:Reverse transcriptase domain-containing protein n=1 Tax=Perkinsus olseni TaxID=32597 RepID=A0A7J6KUS9_PEROL|nr:hypothetical protein FOZ61_000145 [Perkinsus olseni]
MAQRCPRCGLRHRLADCAISPTVRCQRPQGTDRASSTGKGGLPKRASAYTIEVGCTSQSKASTSDATTGATQGARSSSDPLSCVVDLTCVEQNFTGAENEVLKESWSLKMMTGPDTVSLRIGNLDVCALVDSGAAVAMIREELASRLHQEGIIERRKIKPVIITCANHTSRTVDEECILQVSLSRGSEGCASFYIPALVVKDLSYPIILGRVALRIVGAKLLYSLEDDEASKIQSSLKEEILERPSPTRHIEERGAPSLDVPVIDIAQIEVSCSEEEKCVKNLEDDIIREEEPQSANLLLRGNSRTTLEEQIEKLLVNIPPEADFYATALSRIHDHGPFPLPDALKYTVQLKTLEELEHEEGHDAAVPDIPQQQYRFYIDWPEKVEKKRELERDYDVRSSWRPTGLIQRLSNAERKKWQEELSMYFNRHWWVDTGITVPNKESDTQFATCFPVVSLRKVTTPVRPCLDCRVINRQYPSAHNRRNSTHCAIQQLQGLLQPAWRVEQMDLSKAYYRLAIGRELLIDCGDMTLKMTRRLAFGLSSGPASLEGVIDILFTVLRYKHPHIRTVRIMDDFLILSRNEEERQAWNADMFQLLAKCGFEIPDSKRSMWEEDSPQKWLGMKWRWDSAKGNLFVDRPEIKIDESIESRRGYFANAGKFLELTKSSAEAQCRGHCDIVRQLSGRAENSWDGILPKDVRDKCDLHLKAAEDLWQQIDQRVPLISGVKTVRLFTDASFKGYGIEFWAPAKELYGAFRSREGGGEEEREDWVSIYGEAHLFPDRAESWHANRREMFAILQSLTALCQQFERNWWRSLRTIVLGSDSFTAIRRMGGPERKLKGIEWLATRRIRDCTDDIIAELKTMSISVSFIHHHNTSFFTKRVDILSRIIDDIPFSRELLSIHASLDVPLTAIDLTVAIDDSKVPLLAFEVFDLYYPHSLLLPTLENVPSLKTYYDLDKTFHAWKGDSATPKHELIRRFLIREQEKDPGDPIPYVVKCVIY